MGNNSPCLQIHRLLKSLLSFLQSVSSLKRFKDQRTLSDSCVCFPNSASFPFVADDKGSQLLTHAENLGNQLLRSVILTKGQLRKSFPFSFTKNTELRIKHQLTLYDLRVIVGIRIQTCYLWFSVFLCLV